MSILYGVFIQTKLYRIKADITKCDKNKEFLFDIPVIIGEGPDWEAASTAKFRINSVDISVKPAYNFCTMASSEMGKVSVDFPVRMAFYSGSTVLEKGFDKFSKYMLDSKVELGTATTGIKAQYGGAVYKTTLKSDVNEETTDLKTSDILQKDQTSGWIDNYSLENLSVILQKGRIAVCVKVSDLIVDPTDYLTETGNGNNDNDNGNGSTRRIINSILERRRTYGVEPEEKKGKKVGRQNPPPVVDKKYYSDNTAQDGSLILDYPFYVTQIYDVSYQRQAN